MSPPPNADQEVADSLPFPSRREGNRDEFAENAEKMRPGSDIEGKPVKVRDQGVAGSNPVAPTFLRKKPFGENVEGLSHCGSRSCG